MDVNDPLHRLAIGKADVMKEATPEERVRQLLLVVRSNNHDRSMPGLDCAARLVDIEFHAVELEQQIVGELDIRLVDLVDQQNRCRFGLERLPQLAGYDIVADIMDPRIAELA